MHITISSPRSCKGLHWQTDPNKLDPPEPTHQLCRRIYHWYQQLVLLSTQVQVTNNTNTVLSIVHRSWNKLSSHLVVTSGGRKSRECVEWHSRSRLCTDRIRSGQNTQTISDGPKTGSQSIKITVQTATTAAAHLQPVLAHLDHSSTDRPRLCDHQVLPR